MHKFGRAVVKFRIPILIVSVILLIPAAFGMINTRINYDMLDYLPSSMDTVVGQDILKEDFGKGAFSLIVTEDMSNQDVADLTSQIKDVPHVVDALSYPSLVGTSIPDELIPDDVKENFKNGDSQLIAVFFDSGTSSDDTMAAVTQIREISSGENVYVSGMSALVTDLKNIAEREEPQYVAIAVACALLVLLLFTDSWLAPFLFLISIGMAILYNLGSNVFMGEISYITKALAAVLQLAVTMDYSIFLWHSYEEKRQLYPGDIYTAMGEAIGDTLTAIFSSALTASAGFLALCFMSYTLGADLGVVMAKGCLLGLLASITILPSLILVFNRPIAHLGHKNLIPQGVKLANFVTKRYWIFLVAFVILLIPATIGFVNKPVYYDFTNTLTGSDTQLSEEDTQFHTADVKLEDNFDVATTEMILCRSDMSHADAKEMLDRINDVDGVKYALGKDSVIGGLVPTSAIPSALSDSLVSGDYQLIIINSAYQVSTDAVNQQIDEINTILKEYDPDAMLIGEAPATKDLISTTDHDFVVVDLISIVAILLILLLVFRSGSLPFILVLVIEFAIFINLGIPYYTGDVMPFIAPICISTIQLGSTVNYAILMTTRYRKERYEGMPEKEAISTALSTSMRSIITSAASFFGATFGVSLYSNVGIISSMCSLMARGALVSMVSVLFVLPAAFILFDKLILKTSKGFKPKNIEAGTNQNSEEA